jgi:hypothetical protein
MEELHNVHTGDRCRRYSLVSEARNELFEKGLIELLRLGPMITPGLVILSKTYDVSIDRVSSIMVGSLAFSSGFTTFFVASGATIWGKRAFFVLSMIFLLVTCVWGYVTRVRFLILSVRRVLTNRRASHPLPLCELYKESQQLR